MGTTGHKDLQVAGCKVHPASGRPQDYLHTCDQETQIGITV